MRPGLDTLESWGIDVSTDPAIYHRDSYLAGSDEARAAAINRAIRDDSVDAIIFSRGGYGAMRILDHIDWSPLRERPRWLCGFSDITALLLSALHHADVQTLHGPVVKSFELQSQDLHVLRSHLFGESVRHAYDVTPVRSGKVTGHAIGGNLSLVAALLDSHHVPAFDDAVLFLEDVGEADYRLDRLLTSLRLARRTRDIRAIVLGEFVGCEGVYVGADEIQSFVRELGRELGNALDIPVVADFPSGHGARNVPIPFGAPVSVDGSTGRVVIGDE